MKTKLLLLIALFVLLGGCFVQRNERIETIFKNRQNDVLFQEFYDSIITSRPHRYDSLMFFIFTQVNDNDTIVSFHAVPYPLLLDTHSAPRLKIVNYRGYVLLLAWLNNKESELFINLKNNKQFAKQLVKDIRCWPNRDNLKKDSRMYIIHNKLLDIIYNPSDEILECDGSDSNIDIDIHF